MMPTPAIVSVIVFAAVALGLAAVAVWLAWSAREQARDAHDAARGLVLDAARRAVEEREVNLGPPRGTGERRREDRGPAARHRAPDDEALGGSPVRHSRLVASRQAREAGEVPPTEQIAVQPGTGSRQVDTGDLPTTAVHAAPRRPGSGPNFREPAPAPPRPALPPPGRIDRDR